MKLHLVLCTAWWFLHVVLSVQSASLEDYLKLKESNNAVIEELALEALEVEDAHIEMPPLEESDIDDAMREEEYLEKLEMDDLLGAMAHNEAMNKEEHVPYPSGKSTWTAPGPYTYCGPHPKYYNDEQCPVVGNINSHKIPVAACELLCQANSRCSAFNWSIRSHLGCVLRDCGNGNPPAPNETLYINDWVSFSKRPINENGRCNDRDEFWPAKG